MDKYGVRICPFNRSHAVPIKTYQTHIIRCQRNYRGRKISCPYKASEFIYPEDLIDHMKTCPSYSPQYDIACGDRHGAFPPTEFFHKDLPKDDEDDWD